MKVFGNAQSQSRRARIVASFSALMHPFKWLHLLAPILNEDVLPVLGAPFPFFVGILEKHLGKAKVECHSDLADVVIVDSTKNGRISWNEVDANNELYKKLPRRLRNKIERRLTRCKTSCLRLLYRSTNAAPNLDHLSNHVQNGMTGEHFQVQ